MLSLILILKSYSTCGVGYDRKRCAEFIHRSLSRYALLTLFRI
ncbi:hypothetical protein [Leptospira noguchii]|nr:hypothetical protein [Leptospira noguchii]